MSRRLENPARRRILQAGGGAVTLALFGCGRSSVAVPIGRSDGEATAAASYLTAEELATLSALVDRFIPGPPEDLSPGAVAAACHEAIDALLAAFQVSPPRIFAGAPFSDRGGAAENDFEKFLPLDPYEERAWRLRIEGSKGNPALEFNGPIPGLQSLYREGLAALAAAGFNDMPAPARDLFLQQASDPLITRLVDVAAPHTFEFMYGAPEYGGNRDEAGWDFIAFDGDTQPRGYTREEVENRVPAGGRSKAQQGQLPEALRLLPALGCPETMFYWQLAADGRLSAYRKILQTQLPQLKGLHRG